MFLLVIYFEACPFERLSRAPRSHLQNMADPLLLERQERDAQQTKEKKGLRSEVNSELNFSPNFEGLVLGCIDADFCK